MGYSENDLVISYLGSLGTSYMVYEMLAFFVELKKTHSQAKFLFITPSDPELVYKDCKALDIEPHDIQITKANREDVPRLLSVCDLSIFFVKPTFSRKAMSPTKQGEIMSMGIPIICNHSIGDTESIITEYNAGKVVQEFTKREYRAVVDNIYKIIDLDKERIRQGAKEIYSLKIGVEKYAGVYLDMIGEA